MLHSHDALHWRVSLGSVSSSSQSKWDANPLQDYLSWQCTKGPFWDEQSPSKAEDELDQCGAICHKQHNDVVELEHAQRRSSNPWSLLSTDVHILACVIRSSREFFAAASHLCFRKSSRKSVFSVCNTLPCAQACCFASSHARGDSAETHHPQSGQDQSNAFVRRRQTSISLVPAKSAAAARNFAEPEFLGNKRPKSRTIMARSNTGGRSLVAHGLLPR